MELQERIGSKRGKDTGGRVYLYTCGLTGGEGLHERIRSAVELSVSGMARGLFWRPSVVGKDDAGSVGLDCGRGTNEAITNSETRWVAFDTSVGYLRTVHSWLLFIAVPSSVAWHWVGSGVLRVWSLSASANRGCELPPMKSRKCWLFLCLVYACTRRLWGLTAGCTPWFAMPHMFV